MSKMNLVEVVPTPIVSPSNMLLMLIQMFTLLLLGVSSTELSLNFYENSCPKLLSTIRKEVDTAIANEARMGASLLRLHFHDCFATGCDASVLLDDTPTFTGKRWRIQISNL